MILVYIKPHRSSCCTITIFKFCIVFELCLATFLQSVFTFPTMTRHDPIVVTGFAFRLPQGAVDGDSLWDLLTHRKNAMAEWPTDRINIKTFADGGRDYPNTVYAHGGHFIEQDPRSFDAPFFSITANEASTMDPAQRLVLETVYHAFENAGTPLDRLNGSDTAVLGVTSTDDYARFISKDVDQAPRMAATGTAPAMLPNKVSWFFNLHGPSLLVDTACSSSMVAIDMACQYIHNGYATSAVVVGSNLMLGPECSVMLGNLGFLSEDSVCHSFDNRANGYARGEGVVALVIKALPEALNDGDMIRAVIRASTTNQDGRTPGLTQPSSDSQESMIRQVYNKAGLDYLHTRYVEAHGTGTPVGDPLEMKAIGRVFRTSRSKSQPLYVGSIKSNIGHLEATSGLAGVVKAIMALEKGVIPPNALFEKINPTIDTEFYHIEVPTTAIPWPTNGLRRASVNSFGFGGTNSHLILDDAMHYLKSRGLEGHHNTLPLLGRENGIQSRMNGICGITNGTYLLNGDPLTMPNEPRLLIWSASDENALKRMIREYGVYYMSRTYNSQTNLDQLAHTLATRRSELSWRGYAVIDSSHVVTDKEPFPMRKPVRASIRKGLAFVFTGQGAQYAKMGLELLKYSEFKTALLDASKVLESLGCAWSILDALRDESKINLPDYSQPLCTALQIALVRLLRSFGIRPSAVVGHSSGEIAAAYTMGALTEESALKVAYYRGRVAAKLKIDSPFTGAMMAVNLPEHKLQEILDDNRFAGKKRLHIACINSPHNCTISGDEVEIDELQRHLEETGVVAQTIRAGIAYHSPIMKSLGSEYIDLMGQLVPADFDGTMDMISSVTGRLISPNELLTPQYWVDNLISPVRFSDAILSMIETSSEVSIIDEGGITDIVEIGPHCALRRPLRDTLKLNQSGQIVYAYALHRNEAASRTLLELVGHLFCRGYNVSIRASNNPVPASGQPMPFLVDCPQYPFDTSRKYWYESRLSRDYRLREGGKNEVLGVRAHDWNPLEPRWRNFWNMETTPWLRDHVVNNVVLLPGTAMLTMAIEAMKQIAVADRPVAGFCIKKAEFINAISVSRDASTETVLHIRPLRKSYEKESTWSRISIFSYSNDRWTKCFQATAQIQYQEEQVQVDEGTEKRLSDEAIVQRYYKARDDCLVSVSRTQFYKRVEEAGITFGKAFQLLDDIRHNNAGTAVARVGLDFSHLRGCLVHPAVLDAAIHLSMIRGPDMTKSVGVTHVPSELHDMWISATEWAQSVAVNIRTSAEKLQSSNGLRTSTCLIDEATTNPLCEIGNVILRPVARVDSGGPTKLKLLYGVDWKPQMSLLSPQQLCQICDANTIPEDDTGMSSFYPRLEDSMDVVIIRTLNELTATDLARAPKHISKLISWMQRHAADRPAVQVSVDGPGVENILIKLCEERPKWKLYEVLSANILPIIRGQTDPLELLVSSGLAEDFYSEIFDRLCDSRLRRFFDLATHENPNMRILEVGGGTGGFTRCILSVLQALEECRGGDAFAEYTYTDISPSFFEAIRDKYGGPLQERLQLGTFNIEKDPSSEGLEEGAYDIIIAGSVIHATSDLSITLKNLRRAIKPGGYLVFLEVLAPYSAAANLGFGVFEGWWLSVEDWRSNGPTITAEKWDHLLRKTGFSGNDMIFRDYEDDRAHLSGILFSRATEPKPSLNRRDNPGEGTLFFVLDSEDTQQLLMSEVLSRQLSESLNFQKSKKLPLGDMKGIEISAQDLVIVLLEINSSFLSSLLESDFDALKDMMNKVRNLVWVVVLPEVEGPDNAQYSQRHLSIGFLRSMRSEALDRHFVTLIFETGDLNTSNCATHIVNVVEVSYKSGLDLPDDEYIVRDGILHTGRAIEESALNDQVQALVSPQIQVKPWNSGPPVKLAIRNRGFLDSLEFVEDESATSQLQVHEVEIDAKAWGLSFRDIFVALGRLDGDSFGYDCAGIVVRKGAEVQDLKVGDRVVMTGAGCMRARPRSLMQGVVQIPDSLSFAAAASVVSPGITAYHSLVRVARLQKGETILIHAASGSTGQMAIWIAKMTGAEVFATVGLNMKKKLLMDQFGIPPDHIFYSRNTTFAKGVMRATGGRGVDVVLNSLSGDGLRASWECVAPFGRFIELGKADIAGNSSLPMINFARNISFIAVDLHHLGLADPKLASQLTREMMNLVTRGLLRHPEPLHMYALSEVEQAFRYMQSGRNTGRIVLEANDADLIPKRILERRDWTCDPNASYLVAGGLGGIGREILRWLASKGAQYLIVPSRSGGKGSLEAAKVITELTELGVHIETPACDVSDITSLKNVLEECSQRMPLIKGCINAAMVLQDAVFSNMKLTQWDLTLRSKMNTAWNLHNVLPKSMDFFVLLSSLAGIYGSPGQSNYAASCSFQDSLARYRTLRGEKAVSLDVGWMRTIGIIAENEDYKRHRKNTADMGHIEKEELMSLLNIYCQPDLPVLTPEKSQLLIGIVTPRDLVARGQPVTPLARRPLFSAFSRLSGSLAGGGGVDDAINITALFRQAQGMREKCEVVVTALVAKLARALAVSPDYIDPYKRLSDCGVDSLMAVELRNWVGAHFRAEVAVFEIMGGMTIIAIGKLVVDRSDLKTDPEGPR
ncbi:hypothetical protein F5Y10DRAFT_242011 [Nemania abortiva]|nr:hypothetical protein F5Y10DRAFT_242011 [Nemania abortiva]